jgi:TPR repeat protein
MLRFAILIAALVIALLRAGPAGAADADAAFREGLAAYNTGSYARALAAWEPIAKAGDARAQAGLGFMYYSGRGVPRDSARAAELFHLAADQSEPTAQLFLALMHFKSDGVPASAPLAMMWAELAIAGGQVGAFELRGTIMQSMTDAERAEGWRLLAEWRANHRK